jgi:hypothetical protein
MAVGDSQRANARYQSRFQADHGKSRLRFEGEFIYGATQLPDWTKVERRTVKYSLTRRDLALE